MANQENKREYIKNSEEDYKKEMLKEKNKLYSRQYRKDLKNGNRQLKYKVRTNTKRYKKDLDRVKVLEGKILKIKKELGK